MIALPDVPNEFGWGMIAVGATYAILAISYHVLKPRKAKDEILSNLRKLRRDGVALRNRGKRLNTEDKVDSWIKETDEWGANVIAVLEKGSEAETAYFETLDQMPPRIFPSAINERHLLYLSIITERLQRLMEIMRRLEKS